MNEKITLIDINNAEHTKIYKHIDSNYELVVSEFKNMQFTLFNLHYGCETVVLEFLNNIPKNCILNIIIDDTFNTYRDMGSFILLFEKIMDLNNETHISVRFVNKNIYKKFIKSFKNYFNAYFDKKSSFKEIYNNLKYMFTISEIIAYSDKDNDKHKLLAVYEKEGTWSIRESVPTPEGSEKTSLLVLNTLKILNSEILNYLIDKSSTNTDIIDYSNINILARSVIADNIKKAISTNKNFKNGFEINKTL